MQDDATGASPPLNRGRAADLIGRSALSAHQKLILLAYMSHLPSDRPPDSGVAWPGLDTLSTWASCSRSTAQAARAELLTAGVLVAVERGDTSMKCRLDFERLASWEPPARESRRGGCRCSAPNPPQSSLPTNPPQTSLTRTCRARPRPRPLARASSRS